MRPHHRIATPTSRQPWARIPADPADPFRQVVRATRDGDLGGAKARMAELRRAGWSVSDLGDVREGRGGVHE